MQVCLAWTRSSDLEPFLFLPEDLLSTSEQQTTLHFQLMTTPDQFSHLLIALYLLIQLFIS